MTQASVGIVETQIVELDLCDDGFVLEKGGCLPKVSVAYETYGTLNESRDNVIWICHALTGDAHVAGRHTPSDRKPGWWDPMIGPGKAIDTDQFFVVCSNVLGGCKGTTGPSSTDPRTGKPYGIQFPEITIGDMVEVQHRLASYLEIAALHAVIGGSMGGLQVLEWSLRFPDFVRHGVLIASAESCSAQALAFDIIGRNAIMADPGWQKGFYSGTPDRPVSGLSIARMLAHVTYLSAESMAAKFGRQRREDYEKGPFGTDFQIESYLDYQGRSFVDRFDANSYLFITLATDQFAIHERARTLEDALEPVQAKFLVVALSSDWLFPPEQSERVASALLRAGKNVSCCELKSPYGHDAFLLEIEHLSSVVSSFLTYPQSAPEPSSAPIKIEYAPSGSRGDFGRIEKMVAKGSHVLDLGCGDGTLLSRLRKNRNAQGQGIDVSLGNLIRCNANEIAVFQKDIDDGLSMIPDNTYDYAILSETLQVIRKPDVVIQEMLRVAREGILSFPNCAHWRRRKRLTFRGKSPRSRKEPWHWYNTPTIRLFSLKDFCDLCNHLGVEILEMQCIPDSGFDKMLLNMGLRNLGAERVVVRVAGKQ